LLFAGRRVTIEMSLVKFRARRMLSNRHTPQRMIGPSAAVPASFATSVCDRSGIQNAPARDFS